ncbi:MAGUK p55 subfamily member 7 isoform X15 [Takifugu flavidus]|uniref:MAGUK p55 subfamily member 7 isoform X15 n=1 Tax=Takifugu flavidus TaxID=433684 RepID=UPI0025445DBA|nr:MAGUK p55 subfamily member 7 isoform X15 [Takifugu flavidus]
MNNWIILQPTRNYSTPTSESNLRDTREQLTGVMPALATGTGYEPGFYDLLVSLPSQLQPHVIHPEDSTFLKDMFGEKSLHSLIKIHDILRHYEESKPLPVLDSAVTLASQLAELLEGKLSNGEIRELQQILSKPFFKSILSVHDTVAQKNYDPELPPLPEDIDDDEDSVKIIRLVKNKEPLGATIRRDDDTGAILVARIMKGGAADRSGLIHIGDELKEVNGIPVDDKKPEEVIRILSQSQGAITFKVVPCLKEEVPSKEPKVFVKALFNFDPNEDKAIPCKEAGLAFKKGSILQIMSQDDATWWQARLEVEANPRAGLIPSKQFQERRFALRGPAPALSLKRTPSRRSCKHKKVGFRRSFRLSKRDKKTNKAMYESPTGVGLNELKKKLLISDPQHFGVTIPHTSRAKRNQESDGVEYHFISKHLFETDIHNNKFIEYGEYKGNYYGTSLDSIRSILSKNKVCLLDVQPQMIKHLRTAEFKPFVVFVKPPLIERLSETRQNAKFMSGKEDKGSVRPFKEEDFQEMVRTSEVMENQYGHLFDKVIVNDDLSIAFNELRMVLRTVETETHWVPVSWNHS